MPNLLQKLIGWYSHQCETLVSAAVIRPAKRRAKKYMAMVEKNPFDHVVTVGPPEYVETRSRGKDTYVVVRLKIVRKKPKKP